MREDLNLSGEDTDCEVIPQITRARTQVARAELFREEQGRQDDREVQDLNAQLGNLEIGKNVTQRRSRQTKV